MLSAHFLKFNSKCYKICELFWLFLRFKRRPRKDSLSQKEPKLLTVALLKASLNFSVTFTKQPSFVLPFSSFLISQWTAGACNTLFRWKPLSAALLCWLPFLSSAPSSQKQKGCVLWVLTPRESMSHTALCIQQPVQQGVRQNASSTHQLPDCSLAGCCNPC